MTEPSPLAPPPRRVRPGPVLRRKRGRALIAVAALTLLGLIALGFAVAPRLSLLRHAVRVTARVADHHLTVNRVATCTLYVELPREMGDGIVTVNVDPETYDRTAIGDEATFYVDPTNPRFTSEAPPSLMRLLGFALGCVALALPLFAAILIPAWELTPEQKEERRWLVEASGGTLEITESRPSVTLPTVSVVAGRTTDSSGKRWRTENLQVGHPVVVGDRIPILIDPKLNKLRSPDTLTAFELLEPPTP